MTTPPGSANAKPRPLGKTGEGRAESKAESQDTARVRAHMNPTVDGGVEARRRVTKAPSSSGSEDAGGRPARSDENMIRSSLKALIPGLSLVLGLGLLGCAEGDIAPAPGGDADGIEIEGTWENALYGEIDVIDDESWSSDFGDGPTVSEIVEFSNSERYAVLSGADFTDPDKTVYSRVVWTEPEGDSFYFCTATFGCETVELTATGYGDEETITCNAPMPDQTDMDKGCGGFSWTALSKK